MPQTGRYVAISYSFILEYSHNFTELCAFISVPVKVKIHRRYTGKVKKGGSRLFEIPITIAGIYSIEIWVEIGKLMMHVSEDFNPNDMTSNEKKERIKGDETKTVKIKPQDLKRGGKSGKFYCNFVGEEDSTFSVKVTLSDNN